MMANMSAGPCSLRWLVLHQADDGDIDDVLPIVVMSAGMRHVHPDFDRILHSRQPVEQLRHRTNTIRSRTPASSCCQLAVRNKLNLSQMRMIAYSVLHVKRQCGDVHYAHYSHANCIRIYNFLFTKGVPSAFLGLLQRWLDLDPITLIYQVNGFVGKMYMRIKNDLSRSGISKVVAQQTNIHTYWQTNAHKNIHHATRLLVNQCATTSYVIYISSHISRSNGINFLTGTFQTVVFDSDRPIDCPVAATVAQLQLQLCLMRRNYPH